MGFIIMRKAIGMLLCDLESSFRCTLPWQRDLCTSYNMAARALADLSHEGAKRPSAINQLSGHDKV